MDQRYSTMPVRGGPSGALKIAAALLGVACWLGGAGSALAADYYVEKGHPACSNTGPGTEAEPYCDIQPAVDARAAADTTIFVKPGTGAYRERVVVKASGTSDTNRFVLQAFGGVVTVDGSKDYASSGQWELHSGGIFKAVTVTWEAAASAAEGEAR